MRKTCRSRKMLLQFGFFTGEKKHSKIYFKGIFCLALTLRGFLIHSPASPTPLSPSPNSATSASYRLCAGVDWRVLRWTRCTALVSFESVRKNRYKKYQVVKKLAHTWRNAVERFSNSYRYRKRLFLPKWVLAKWVMTDSQHLLAAHEIWQLTGGVSVRTLYLSAKCFLKLCFSKLILQILLE